MTVFIHILAMYLNDNNVSVDQTGKKYSNELNDLVLKKLINLGTNHRVEFKQILSKWPTIKTKIEAAFKQSVDSGASSSVSYPALSTPPSNFASQTTKAPKIQLKNFANFK